MRSRDTTNVFAPLHQIIELLQEFKVKVKKEVTDDLAAVPLKWDKMVKTYNTVREMLKPLVETEVSKISQEEMDFLQRVCLKGVHSYSTYRRETSDRSSRSRARSISQLAIIKHMC